MSGKKSGQLTLSSSRRQFCENEFDNLWYSDHRCHPLLRAVWRDPSVQHDDVRVLPPGHHQPLVRPLSGGGGGRREQGQWAKIPGYRGSKTRIIVKMKKLFWKIYTVFTLTSIGSYSVNSSIYHYRVTAAIFTTISELEAGVWGIQIFQVSWQYSLVYREREWRYRGCC